MARDKLLLLDTPSLYFRAFYGIPESVTAPDGTPVNAVRGLLEERDRREFEDHASGMVVKGNVFRNCLDTVSYQPLRGEPWPTGIVVSGNVIYNDENDFYAGKGIPNSLFKWGITAKTGICPS